MAIIRLFVIQNYRFVRHKNGNYVVTRVRYL